ncbi:aromatic acid exporter family protein [Streptomyces sp. NPDC052040]|uniref:aromatic acid exporter family protein n=1 Tax=Streptomyces sp. NPDC052040 TaxID=3365682 RepID=UPI0037D468C7
MGGIGRRLAIQVRRTAGYLKAGLCGQGPERDDLVLLIKATAAATAAWYLARWLLPRTVLSFAPLTALLVSQATLYRSLRHGAQYVAALVVGVGLAAGLASWAGVHGWTFVLLALAGLVLARPRPLGEHGFQVVVVAIFAFDAGRGHLGYCLQLVAAVALGAGCGALVQTVAAPARRPVHRRLRVAALFTNLADLLRTAAHSLSTEDARSALTDASTWRERAARISGEAGAAAASVAAEQENARLNPRPDPADSHRLLARSESAICTAHLCATHLQSLARGLDHARADGKEDCLSSSFRRGCADALHHLADGLEQTGHVKRTTTEELEDALTGARSSLHELLGMPEETDARRRDCLILRGALLNDIERIAVELERAPANMDRAEQTARCRPRKVSMIAARKPSRSESPPH